jgi:hypothetical protein
LGRQPQPTAPDVWEVWNEPNLPENNPGGKTIQPQNYANFLQATTQAIQSVQPSAKVLFGGLFSAATQKNGAGEYVSMNVRDYLEATHAVPGTAQAFTALSLHPYAFKGDQVQGVKTNIEFARSALNSVPGGSAKGIWITELGWPISGDANHPGVSETKQEELLTSSFNWVKNNASSFGIQTLVWYFYRDTGTGWNHSDGLRRGDWTFRPAWAAFLAQTGAPPPPPKGVEELGFLHFNTAPNMTQLRTYVGAPNYFGLNTARSSTGYPAISDPQNIQGIAIDWLGDGIPELGFLRFNTASGKTHLDTYDGPPQYQTLASSCDTAYPAIADPQNVQGMAIDTNGGGVDELGFVRLNAASGKAHIDTYTGTPCYTTLASVSDSGYPAVADPQNVQIVATDVNGDGVDELAFVRLKANPTNKVHISTYGGPPFYKDGILTCETGYPEVADPQNVRVLAIDTNGDGIDELGFLRYNASSGKAHLDTYGGAPCYGALQSVSDTGHPAVSNPQDVQAIAINTTNDSAPGAWYSDNIGGTITSDPDVASWGVNHLHVFARGTENTLVNSFWNGNGWSGWASMGGPALASGPGAVSWGQFRIDVVARVASNNSIQHWWWNGTSWLSDNLGASFNSDPDISSWGPNRLDVFARGSENALYHKFWGGSWSGWEKIGGSLASGPSAVSWGPGRIDVVARATNNTVQHWWWDDASGGGWKSDNLGGNIASDPDISSWGPNRLDVYARGPSNDLQHKYWDSGWSAWGYLDGALTSGPGAVSWSPGRLDAFARSAKTPSASESSVQHWFWLDP